MVAVLSATHCTRQRPPLGKTKTPFVCHYFSLISNSSFQTFRLYSFSLFSRLTLRLSSLPLSPTQLSILSDCHQKVFSSRGFYCFDRVAFKGSLRYEFGQRRKNKAEGEVGVKAMAKKVNPPSSKLKGLDDEMKKIIDANMDEAEARRRARDAFKDIQLGIDHCLFKIPTDGLKMEETYVVNSRGLKIFTRSWIPELSPPKAAICYCHGYGDTCTFFFEGIARKLASSGFAVFAMDYPGFGLSDGLHGYIPSFDRLVDDVVEHYSKVKENPDFRNLRFFLFGQSMGGAVALKIHLKQPNSWDGAVLVAPMCKIADDMYPPWILTKLLIGVAKVLPESKLVPERDLAERAFREPLKREQTSYNVIAYKDKPRLQTAVQLLNTTNEIECRLGDVSLPLLILHGEDDVVTDPSVSKGLYEKASSKDKKINLYAGGYHALLEGEPDEMIHQVFKDIVSWLDERVLK